MSCTLLPTHTPTVGNHVKIRCSSKDNPVMAKRSLLTRSAVLSEHADTSYWLSGPVPLRRLCMKEGERRTTSFTFQSQRYVIFVTVGSTSHLLTSIDGLNRTTSRSSRLFDRSPSVQNSLNLPASSLGTSFQLQMSRGWTVSIDCVRRLCKKSSIAYPGKNVCWSPHSFGSFS